MDWIITLPQTVEWHDYERELAAVRDRTSVLNYRVHRPPKAMRAGDRCFLVWRGRVRGWMEIVGVVEHPEGFTCQTTGAYWRPGTYVQRAGEFHVVDGPDIAGFRGVRGYEAPPESTTA
jgi:hypothetical protein